LEGALSNHNTDEKKNKEEKRGELGAVRSGGGDRTCVSAAGKKKTGHIKKKRKRVKDSPFEAQGGKGECQHKEGRGEIARYGRSDAAVKKKKKV